MWRHINLDKFFTNRHGNSHSVKRKIEMIIYKDYDGEKVAAVQQIMVNRSTMVGGFNRSRRDVRVANWIVLWSIQNFNFHGTQNGNHLYTNALHRFYIHILSFLCFRFRCTLHLSVSMCWFVSWVVFNIELNVLSFSSFSFSPTEACN